MTAPVLPRSEAAPWRSSIDLGLAMHYAATEYARCLELMAQLEREQWSAPTVNSGWNVRGGNDGERITLDALDFCRILSGRGDGTGLLTTAVPF